MKEISCSFTKQYCEESFTINFYYIYKKRRLSANRFFATKTTHEIMKNIFIISYYFVYNYSNSTFYICTLHRDTIYKQYIYIYNKT